MRKAIFVAISTAALAIIGCSGGADDHGPIAEGEDLPLGPAPDHDTWAADHPELAAPSESQKNCATRGDHAASINLHSGFWGGWNTCFDYCPINSFAYGVNMKSEAPLGSGDDTSVNAISLHCYNRFSGDFTDYAESSMGPWGGWMGGTGCGGTGNPFEGGNLRVEGPQGSGDDTAVNGINVTCNNAPDTQLTAPANTGWGGFMGLVKCPAGTQVCGIKTRLEGSQGSGDDTALNGVEFACCWF
jgi:hypothetical protein